MSKKYDIKLVVFIHFRAWIRYTRRPHFNAFNNYCDLIIIENPLVLFSNEFLKNLINSIKHYFKYSKGIREDNKSGAKLIRPIIIFPSSLKNKFKLLSWLDFILIKRKLKNLQILNHPSSVYCLTSRHQSWLLPHLKEKFTLLDMNDEWSMMPYNEEVRYSIEKDVRDIIEDVSLVTCVTKQLQEKYNKNGNVVFLPNAVDTQHYKPKFDSSVSKATEESIHKLVDLKFIEKEKNDPRQYKTDLSVFDKYEPPFVGSYSGLSGNWSDFAFMNKVESTLPEEFTMISSGTIHPPSNEKFFKEYNTYLDNQRMIYLGYVDYSHLPDFLEKLSVGLVMHRADDFNIHSAPNKIWAYLAMGLPVVSTNFLKEHDKEIYEGYVHFAETPEEYVELIIQESKTDSIEKKLKRRDLAVRYSADNRADNFLRVLEQKLQKSQ